MLSVKILGRLRNLATEKEYQAVRASLRRRLLDRLKATGDPRVTGNGDVWETYPRVSKLRWFETPEWAIIDPLRVPVQKWLEKQRPRSDWP